MRKSAALCLLLTPILILTIWKPFGKEEIIPEKLMVEEHISQLPAPEEPKADKLHIEEKEAEEPVEHEGQAVKEVFMQSFTYSPISKDIKDRISGLSWKEGSPVELEDLRYLQVTYWGFDDKPHIGEMIVNKDVAEEVVEIFEELYSAKFPIEKIRLIDEYVANDSKSMADNNTSAFCFREVEGKPGQISKHGLGIAIDINPVQNPYIYKEKIMPAEGKEYTDRKNTSKGMIVKGDACYKAFTERSWTWGGDWKYEKDYQHFQKKR